MLYSVFAIKDEIENGIIPDIIPFFGVGAKDSTGWRDVAVILPYYLWTFYGEKEYVLSCLPIIDAMLERQKEEGLDKDFVEKTGVDSLAIAIGTSHGAFKFKPGQKPMLRFDILEEIERRVPNFPIVLHGASSVSQEYVRIIQANGGNLADAIGIPEDMLRQAAKSAVCKINIDSDLRLAMTAGVREVLANKPEAFDPREYLKAGRANVKALVAHKIQNVLGSEGKAL